MYSRSRSPHLSRGFRLLGLRRKHRRVPPDVERQHSDRDLGKRSMASPDAEVDPGYPSMGVPLHDRLTTTRTPETVSRPRTSTWRRVTLVSR
jgi:hypothetical protein